MGASSSIDKSVAPDLAEFVQYFIPLAQQTPQAKSARATAWLGADNSGNGICSLAEIDGWIQKVLIGDLGYDRAVVLWKRFRPSYIRAFNDAKDVATKKHLGGNTKSTTTSDDYVTRGEFRVLNAYICIYATIYDAFTVIDGGSGVTADDDRRISLDELKKNYGAIAKYPLAGANPDDDIEAIFKKMDSDGKGMVLLKEFCQYMEHEEQERATDIGKLLAIGDDEELRTVSKVDKQSCE